MICPGMKHEIDLPECEATSPISPLFFELFRINPDSECQLNTWQDWRIDRKSYVQIFRKSLLRKILESDFFRCTAWYQEIVNNLNRKKISRIIQEYSCIGDALRNTSVTGNAYNFQWVLSEVLHSFRHATGCAKLVLYYA